VKISNISDFHLQKMRLRVKSPSSLALYFEGDQKIIEREIRQRSVPPVAYAKSILPEDLFYLILLKGYPRSADILGVSTSFLQSLVRTHMDSCTPFKGALGRSTGEFNPVSKEDVLRLSKIVTSATLLEAVTGWSKSQLKAVLPSLEQEVSNLTSYKGRKAELFYRKYRGHHIVRDLNETDRKAVYDFDDDYYGRVDVKSSKQSHFKSGERRWYFSLKGTGCDQFACVGYDARFENPVFVLHVKNTNEIGKSRSLIVRESHLQGKGVHVLEKGSTS